MIRMFQPFADTWGLPSKYLQNSLGSVLQHSAIGNKEEENRRAQPACSCASLRDILRQSWIRYAPDLNLRSFHTMLFVQHMHSAPLSPSLPDTNDVWRHYSFKPVIAIPRTNHRCPMMSNTRIGSTLRTDPAMSRSYRVTMAPD